MRRFFCFILILVSVYMMATKGFSPERIYFRRASSAAEGSPLATVHLSTENIPDAQIQLAVPYISQLPELRNGCEITSSAMILNYYGFTVDKCLLADDYLPKLYPYITADPEEGYMGDPYTLWGYYCMTKPIVTAINEYLEDQSIPLWQAEDISGVSIKELQNYIANGFPVQVWVTKDFEKPTYYNTFLLPDATQPYANLHCIVITGMSASEFYYNDPLYGKHSVSFEKFESAFSAIGNRAVYLRKSRD